MKIASENTVEADGGLPIYEVRPEKARGAVVVVQEAFGVNNHITDVARRFAGQGYHAVAPLLFHRDGVNEISYDDLATAKTHMANFTPEGIREDINATLKHLAVQGFAAPSVGIVGFCMGGSISLTTACDHALGAAVTFYGGGIVEGRFGFPGLASIAPTLQTPWLGLFGDRDQTIPPEHVELLRGEAAKSSVPSHVVRYADAGHGFHCDARPAAYHETSAKDAWVKALDWLTRYLRPH